MHGPSVFYDDNTGYLILDELRDSEVPSQFINSATVTCETITQDGVQLTGAGITYPIAMPYVAASDGKYRCKVADTLNGVAGKVVEAHVKVVSGTDVANFRLRFPFKKRLV